MPNEDPPSKKRGGNRAEQGQNDAHQPPTGAEPPPPDDGPGGGAYFNNMPPNVQEEVADMYGEELSAHLNLGERVIAKLTMTYHKKRGEKFERQALSHKQKMDAFDLSTRALEESRHILEASVEDLRARHSPAASTLQLRMKNIDLKMADLENKRDREQSKFEKNDGKRTLFYNERDRIADKLIGHYEEKMQPMESTLEMLHSERNQLDLTIAVMETHHHTQEERLAQIEDHAKEMQNELVQAGISYREVQDAVRPLAEEVRQGRLFMKNERAVILRQRDAIQKEIARADAKANPYRDRRDALARIKQGRPIEVEAPTRHAVSAETPHESVRSHTRFPPEPPSGRPPRNSNRGSADISRQETREKEPTMRDVFKEWLEFSREEAEQEGRIVPTERDEERITDRFFSKTGYARTGRAPSPADLKKILVAFYKSERAPGSYAARQAEQTGDPIPKRYERFLKWRKDKNEKGTV